MIDYLRPRTVEEVVAALAARQDLQIVAGATDVYPDRAHRAAMGHPARTGLVDISGLSELRGITERGHHWRIGAATTWSEIAAAHALPPLFDGLKAAAREIGGIQIQNRGTIGGNICTASPAGDSIPCLLTLDASVEIVTAGSTQTVPLEAFLTGYRQTIAGVQRGLVTALIIPKAAGRGDFLKLAARRYLVISIAMAAAVIEIRPGGIVTRARLAIGACSPVAQRLPDAEAALIGHRVDPALILPAQLDVLAPVDDVRATAEYRRAAALVLVRDLVARATAMGAR